MSKIEINLPLLTDENLQTINKHLQIRGKTLSGFLEEQLNSFIKISEKQLETFGDCPACKFERGEETKLRGMPVHEAEKIGILRIANDNARETITKFNIYYVFCLNCFWRGFPSKSELNNWK